MLRCYPRPGARVQARAGRGARCYVMLTQHVPSTGPGTSAFRTDDLGPQHLRGGSTTNPRRWNRDLYVSLRICKASFWGRTRNQTNPQVLLKVIKNSMKPENVIQNKDSLWHSALAIDAEIKTAHCLSIIWSGGYFQGYFSTILNCKKGKIHHAVCSQFILCQTRNHYQEIKLFLKKTTKAEWPWTARTITLTTRAFLRAEMFF